MMHRRLGPGATVHGKWTGQVFQIRRELGVGANGTVYLARCNDELMALKQCENAAQAALEWGLLDQLGPQCGALPAPRVADDDAQRPDVFFYTMEWVDGTSLDQQARGMDGAAWRVLLEQWFAGLADLHHRGYAFGDIKPQNVLVTPSRPRGVRFVDVGGVTAFGRSVRQFTPHYDRAFWGLGSRRADAGYDLVGVALVCLFLMTTNPPKKVFQMSPSARATWLEKAWRQCPMADVAQVLQAISLGNIQSAQDCRDRLRTSPSGTVDRRAAAQSTRTSRPPDKRRPASASPGRATRKDWTEWLMWISVGTACTVTLVAWGVVLGWF